MVWYKVDMKLGCQRKGHKGQDSIVSSMRKRSGKGPSRGLLCDYEPSRGPLFQALIPHCPELVHPVVAHVDEEVPRQQRADGEVVEDEGDEAGALLCLRHPDYSEHPHRLASELE